MTVLKTAEMHLDFDAGPRPPGSAIICEASTDLGVLLWIVSLISDSSFSILEARSSNNFWYSAITDNMNKCSFGSMELCLPTL